MGAKNPEPRDVLYRIKRGLAGYVSYLAATLQRLQAAAQPRPDAPRRRWEPWLTHAAAAATASAVTWTAAIMLWGR